MPELIDRCELRKDFCNMCEAMQPDMINCDKKYCMSMEIIDTQPTIDAEPVRHGRWIPVEDALPETDTPVICYMRSGQILVMELSDDDGWYCGITRYNPRAVTHWMPLPEPPKEDENE